MPKKLSPIPTLSVSEAAKFLGVSTRTIRRALTHEAITYTVVRGRYHITLDSLLRFALATTTVKNKLMSAGFGQFVREWKA